uniref:Uncharacterized protein n=1 Tax=viral metagenome TaxID=1070528 RepID=A0A6M3ILU4_9ZZZZ
MKEEARAELCADDPNGHLMLRVIVRLHKESVMSLPEDLLVRYVTNIIGKVSREVFSKCLEYKKVHKK